MHECVFYMNLRKIKNVSGVWVPRVWERKKRHVATLYRKEFLEWRK